MRVLLIAPLLFVASSLHAAALRPDTLQAFDAYVADAERRIIHEEGSSQGFLHFDSSSAAERAGLESRLNDGETVIDRVAIKKIQGGMIHHWIGTVLVPQTNIAQVLGVIHDYDHLPLYYAPKVVGSRLFSHQGNDYRIRMRTREQKVITVILDVDYAVHDGSLDLAHWYSTSHSTRSAEVEDADTPQERDLAPGDGRGFLWAMNTYWRFVQSGDSVTVQCETISLSRDIPTGLGWLIGPYVQNVPRESLEFMLTATRKAVVARNATSAQGVK